MKQEAIIFVGGPADGLVRQVAMNVDRCVLHVAKGTATYESMGAKDPWGRRVFALAHQLQQTPAEKWRAAIAELERRAPAAAPTPRKRRKKPVREANTLELAHAHAMRGLGHIEMIQKRGAKASPAEIEELCKQAEKALRAAIARVYYARSKEEEKDVI